MIFRGLDKNDDWVFGCGRQAYAKENLAIGLDITTTLKTFLTECFFDQEKGVPWFNLLATKDKTTFLLTIKKAIAAVDGVVRVNDVAYNFDINRKLSITYSVDTIYSQTFTGTVQV